GPRGAAGARLRPRDQASFAVSSNCSEQTLAESLFGSSMPGRVAQPLAATTSPRFQDRSSFSAASCCCRTSSDSAAKRATQIGVSAVSTALLASADAIALAEPVVTTQLAPKPRTVIATAPPTAPQAAGLNHSGIL